MIKITIEIITTTMINNNSNSKGGSRRCLLFSIPTAFHRMPLLPFADMSSAGREDLYLMQAAEVFDFWPNGSAGQPPGRGAVTRDRPSLTVGRRAGRSCRPFVWITPFGQRRESGCRRLNVIVYMYICIHTYICVKTNTHARNYTNTPHIHAHISGLKGTSHSSLPPTSTWIFLLAMQRFRLAILLTYA